MIEEHLLKLLTHVKDEEITPKDAAEAIYDDFKTLQTKLSKFRIKSIKKLHQ